MMIALKPSRILRTVPLLVVVSFIALPVHAEYSGGTGEPNDPYRIATAADLIALGETPEDYDKHFILTADIDLDPNLPGRKVFDRAVIGPKDRGAEGDYGGVCFCGVFDGGGHRILHLTINGDSMLGLFGQLQGEVRSLGLIDADVTGSGWYIGGLVAYNARGRVNQCYSSGRVSGGSRVGGLVGCTIGTVTNSYAAGSVTGASHVGGLVGDDADPLWGGYGGVISNCYSVAAVAGTTSVGGLLGRDLRGGIVASFWDMQSSGQTTSAGGKGKTTREMQTAATFFLWGACGNEGIWMIDAGKDYPRLAWEDRPGEVLALSPLSQLLKGTGTASDPYLVYTAEDIATSASFPCEWSKHFRLMFVQGEGTPEKPYLVETGQQIDLLNACSYERDACFRLLFLPGEGTQDSPYLIYTAEQLDLIGRCWCERWAHFQLMADVDLDPRLPGRRVFNKGVIGQDWDTAFCGVFDGNGHTISHLTIVGESELGLFGLLMFGATVKNLGIVDVNITGSGSEIGGLVGCNFAYSHACGTLDNCYSTGVIRGKGNHVGGLVGSNHNCNMTRCHSTAAVSGDTFVGGLVGSQSDGTVIHCRSTGTVSAVEYVGGLIGDNYNSSTVIQCCSTGTVSGEECVGGLVGEHDGRTVSESYSTGAVRGTGYGVGGLIGYYEDGFVIHCYSIGPVVGTGHNVGGLVGASEEEVEESFWNFQTSGQTESHGGTAQTTAEMQAAKTFLAAGWDFVGETANGTEDIWWILEGKDYPRLWWEARN